MANNLFVLIMLWGVGCLLANSGPAYGADAAPAIKSNATGSSGAIEMRRAPVPLVREITTPWSPAPTVEPASKLPAAAAKPTGGAGAEEPPARDVLRAEGAKAAVEADGYKRVTVLGPGPSGTWRVKAYRGNTEVVLTVDNTGSVTAD